MGGEQIGSDGKVNLKKTPFVSLEFYKKANRGFVENNDILMCKDGALTGKVCLVDSPFPIKEVMTNEHVYIMRANKKKISQEYLFYCLFSKNVQDQIKNLAYNKSGQPGLNQQHIKSIKIPLPSLQEQLQIISTINQKERENQVLQKKIKDNKLAMSQQINQIWQAKNN